MDPRVRMVVLAKSWKNGGFCVAGKLLDGSRGWVRPVSDARGGALSECDCRLAGGETAGVLSVVDLPLAGAVPDGVQRENRLLGRGAWRYVAAWDVRRLGELVDDVPDIWLDPVLGPCDRVRPEYARGIEHSLCLVSVGVLDVNVQERWSGGYQYRCSFEYGGQRYQGLKLTSPRLCRRLDRKVRSSGVSAWRFGPVFLCLSLGQPFNGYHYKLIAEVYPG